MTSSFLRVPLAAAFLGLTAGCASHGKESRPEPAPAPGTVTARDIEHAGGGPDAIEKMLQAKTSGAVISRTADGGIAVEIRGPASFYGASAPLYVIDDVPFNPGPRGALTGVNPYAIESIRILKNPEDTGLYGVRGANGVILVTMKKPGKPND